MKRAVLITSICVVFAGLLISGCRKDDLTGSADGAPAGVTDEQTAMKAAVATDAFMVNENDAYAFADQKVAPMNYDDGVQKTDDAIVPLKWGRFITAVTRTTTVTTLPGDTLSVVHIDRVITGELKIRTTLNGTDTTLTKPFTDRAGKNVIFRRVDRDTKKYWKNWIPVGSSLVEGGTDPAPMGAAIKIVELDLKTATDSLTITDPQNYWLRYRWLGYPAHAKGEVPDMRLGQTVTVTATVQSQAADTDYVALRHGFGIGFGHYLRAKMALVSQTGPDGFGYYTRVYTATVTPRFAVGFAHIGVDAMTKATLTDSVAPYSVSWWGVPYRMF